MIKTCAVYRHSLFQVHRCKPIKLATNREAKEVYFMPFPQVKNIEWILFEGFSTVLFLVLFFSTNDVNWHNYNPFKERSVPIIAKAWNHFSLHSNPSPFFLFTVSSVVFWYIMIRRRGGRWIKEGRRESENEEERERESDIPGKEERCRERQEESQGIREGWRER